jgi:hypothetical protein
LGSADPNGYKAAPSLSPVVATLVAIVAAPVAVVAAPVADCSEAGRKLQQYPATMVAPHPRVIAASRGRANRGKKKWWVQWEVGRGTRRSRPGEEVGKAEIGRVPVARGGGAYANMGGAAVRTGLHEETTKGRRRRSGWCGGSKR